MTRKHIPFLPVLCLLLLVPHGIFSQDKTFTLGGKNGWPPLSREPNIARGSGRFGYEALKLASDSRTVTDDTDLLLSFEEIPPSDLAGNYAVVSSTFSKSTNAAMGTGAAVSRGLTPGLILRGCEGSLFGTAGNTGSFTIEFWLCPSISENGEQIFSWRSSRRQDNFPVYQVILASLFNNKLEWRFDNVFVTPDGTPSEVVLTSYSNVIPLRWAHHYLAYDEDSGLLEYKINGKTEAVKFITSTGHEYGDVYPAELGVPAAIEICPRYTGLIDDFRISRTVVPMEGGYDTYVSSGGRFETMPLELAPLGAELVRLDAVTDIPAQTGISFFVRAGDNFYEWTDEQPEWIPVVPGEKIGNVKGKYVQVAGELYPDGTGSATPSVTEIQLLYDEQTTPLPPAGVFATAGDGYVDVRWTASVDYSTEGYLVYYGERPGEYMGRSSSLGPSPIDAGDTLSIRIGGLTNGKIYCFAVAAYNGLGPSEAGELSKEVYARPVRKLQ